MYGHGKILHLMDNNIHNTCGNEIYYGNYNTSSYCKSILSLMNTALGGFNIHNIYDKCYVMNDELYNDHTSHAALFKNRNGAIERGYDRSQCEKLRKTILMDLALMAGIGIQIWAM